MAFDVALRVVSAHLRALTAAVTAALPEAPQLVVLDEPLADALMSRDFPIAPDAAIDLLSAAMAVLEPVATVGVHAAATPTSPRSSHPAPRCSRCRRAVARPARGLPRPVPRNGGWIAWGAVATEGPIGVTSTRSWRQLSTVWCELVQRGCDPEMLRAQSLLTPECGLGTHSPAVAERVCRSLRDVSRSLRSESAAASSSSAPDPVEHRPYNRRDAGVG